MKVNRKHWRRHCLTWMAVWGFSLILTGCNPKIESSGTGDTLEKRLQEQEAYSLEEIPEYSGEPYVVVDENEPEFSEEEITDEAYEAYSALDELGRCGTAEASVGTEIMPDEERGPIGSVRPTGWHTVKYEGIDGNYLYNRCHLLGYQLTGENANEENLITGTRYMNVEGMLPFENLVADYVKETENHVMYRVTPVFDGNDMVAVGVHMQALSVEDDGEGVSYNVFVYNVQPGIEIDYSTGESARSIEADNGKAKEKKKYVLNLNTKKFHKPDCSSVEEIRPENKKNVSKSREELIGEGYEPCGRCKP